MTEYTQNFIDQNMGPGNALTNFKKSTYFFFTVFSIPAIRGFPEIINQAL